MYICTVLHVHHYHLSVYVAYISTSVELQTCMQGDVEQKVYSTVSKTARTLVKEKGIVQGLFKGLGWRIALISTTFFLVNKLKVVFCPFMFPIPK
jgi:hypothetical protein